MVEHIAHSLDMAVLVEVHDEAELERALLAHDTAGGHNNRNLRTLKLISRRHIELRKMYRPIAGSVTELRHIRPRAT